MPPPAQRSPLSTSVSERRLAAGSTEAQLDAEIKRLEGMGAAKASDEHLAWIGRRGKLLTKMKAEL